jgi:YidC/Oxa1 family membrane protein insertase
MTDMRRTLLWGVFLVSLFLLYEAWNKHNGNPSLLAPRPVATAPAPTPALPGPAVPAPAGTAAVPAAAPPATALPSVTAASAAAPSPAAMVNERIDISTDVMKATLETRGGELVRVELLKQVDQNDPKKNVVLLDQSTERLYIAQSGLMPPTLGADAHPMMRVVPGERALKDGANQLEVKFESPEVGGVKLIKTYVFKRNDYLVDVKHEVVNQSGAPVAPRLYMQLVRDGNPPAGESSFYFTFTGPAIYTDASKFTKIDFKSIEKRKPGDSMGHETHADNGWVAMVQHYFTAAWLIDKPNGPRLPREFLTSKVDTNTYAVGMIVPLGDVAPGTTKSLDARLYIGPQEEDKISALAPGLELVKDYGYFKILAEPLFWLLTQLHKIIGNWGFAIVALVVLLKIAFYWLNASAYRSMAKMKAINPKVMEMRERLKDKPQQMQQEMMRIYREEKVNPLGGCLPIFVQMPFFIALYWVLLSSVEMRHAPWIGWITDLSAKDPYYILPLVMTGTSLLQTWLNPTPPDPVQAKMMWIMPLAFSVMFFVFPAGLVLYWLTNNILSITQQYLINKQLGVVGK